MMRLFVGMMIYSTGYLSLLYSYDGYTFPFFLLECLENGCLDTRRTMYREHTMPICGDGNHRSRI